MVEILPENMANMLLDVMVDLETKENVLDGAVVQSFQNKMK